MAVATEPTAPREELTQPKLGFTGWVRFVWRQLTSMKTALLLLLLLAVAAVPGSIFPQRRIDASRVAAYLTDHPTSGPWLDRLSIFDVYSSPWFAAVYLLLFISLVGCVVPRLRHHVKASRARPPRAPRRFERLPAHAVRTITDLTPDEVAERARAALRRRHYRVVLDGAGEAEPSVAAERGYVAEWGNLAFHLALLGMLVAIATGSLFSWSGQVIVTEGKGFSNVLPMYSSFRPGASVDASDLAPFSFTLDNLDVQFEENDANALGAPRMFRADVTVRETPEGPDEKHTIAVNHPLDIAGSRVYLVGNGYAPVITVRDGEGNVSFRGAVTFRVQNGNYASLGVVKAPDSRPKQLGLIGSFLPTAVIDPDLGPISVFPDARDPRLLLLAYTGDPEKDDMRSSQAQSVYTLDTTNLTQLKAANGQPLKLLLAPGDTVDLPGGAGSVTFESLPRYAAFDIHHDPSRRWALLWAVVAVVGLTTSLFARRRRVWVRAVAGEAGDTVVAIGGLARGDDLGLDEHVRSVLDEIAPSADGARVPVPAEVRRSKE